MGFRPEGLSPCYGSLASPDIPASDNFRWTFRGASVSDHQTQYTITIMNQGGTILHTYNQTSEDTVVPFELVEYTFTVGTVYTWYVTTYGQESGARQSATATFIYDNCEGSPSIYWTYNPKQGDIIAKGTYFEEIKENIKTLLKNQKGVPASKEQTVPCTISQEWRWQENGYYYPGDSKSATVKNYCAITQTWVWSSNGWTESGQTSNAPSTVQYQEGGYYGTLSLDHYLVNLGMGGPSKPAGRGHAGNEAITSYICIAVYTGMAYSSSTDTRWTGWSAYGSRTNNATAQTWYDDGEHKGWVNLLRVLDASPPSPNGTGTMGEIKTTSILSSAAYKGTVPFVPPTAPAIDGLFKGMIVPSRKDFVILEESLNFVRTVLKRTGNLDVEELVKDSLGASDVEQIRNYLNFLASVPPQPAESFNVGLPAPIMYGINSLNVVSSGTLDQTVQLSWNVGNIVSQPCSFTFGNPSVSSNVRYYRVLFQYGPTNGVFTSDLYYRKQDVYKGVVKEAFINWNDIYTASTVTTGKQQVTIYAVDHQENTSIPVTTSKSFNGSSQIPLGASYFEAEYQKAPLGTTAGYDINGTWIKCYSGSSQTPIHTISGGQGRYFYRVRVIDISGLVSDWSYHNGITFDPLTPPATPGNFHAVEIGTNYITFDWNAAERAESYELVRWLTPPNPIYSGTNTYGTETGLIPNSSYNFYVRAVNRVGYSNWTSITVRTKSSRVTKAKKAIKGDSWNSGYNSIMTGNRIANSHWRNEGGLVYQGEWCEIKGSPNYIGPPNQCWGKHKGMWIMDDDWWRTNLSGKDIIKVELWLQRKGAAHGYYDDQQPTFWLHNYDNFPGGEPSFFGKWRPGKEFDLGESGWVTLPNWYGEYIRDNKAKGIGIYVDGWGKLPYAKFYGNAELKITYE